MHNRLRLPTIPARLGLLGLLALFPGASPAPAGGSTAAPLDWLAGSWQGVKDGTVSEEHWTTGSGGAHVGMHKDVRGGRMISFEFLRIETGADGKPCYVASPRGAAPTTFCAIEVGDRRVVFENREHDFPQRILYWIDADGALHARVEGPADGRELAEEWVWTRTAKAD